MTVASFDTTAFTAWGLGILCILAIGTLVLLVASTRYQRVTVVVPSYRHASDEFAEDHNHQPRHGESVRQVEPETYNRRAWLLDEPTGPINITGEWMLTGEEVVPPMGQDPRIAEPIAPCVDDLFTTDWFSDARMAGRR